MQRSLTPPDFWAKLAQDDDGAVTAWHPLAAHSAEDVTPFEGGFSFAFGGQRFRYDRMRLADREH